MLDGGVLLLESSEDLIPAQECGFILLLTGQDRSTPSKRFWSPALRRPASREMPDPAGRGCAPAVQRDTAIGIVERYNAAAVVCVGVPFGHTRPQWILPYGGTATADGANQRVWADYG